MNNLTEIKFDIFGIGKFISESFMVVPIYQRAYSWEEKNVQELLEDIDQAQPHDYFIGSIVVTKSKDEVDVWEVVDGQQRLATIIILYSAIRNFFNANSDQIAASEIEREYICKIDIESKDIIPRLKLSIDDNNYFMNKIIKNNNLDINEQKKSHLRLKKAYQFAYKFIENKVKLDNNNTTYIFRLNTFIKDQVKIIRVKVPDESNAFTIFETLNDRGLVLSQVDLIKNFLFNKAKKNRLPEAQSCWSEMTGAIEAAKNEEEIMRYIRYFWLSRNGLTRDNLLFSEIKENNNNQNLSLSFLNDLKITTNKYLAILNPNHDLWVDYTPKTKEYVQTFIDLRLYQNRPILLSILNQFDNEETEKTFKIILSWCVRNLITGSIALGTLEREFSNIAKKINKGDIKSSKDLLNSANKIIPTDEQFKEVFSIATVSRNNIAQYYLIEIEKFYSNTEEKSVIKNFDIVNIEHILPQVFTGKKDWPEFDEDSHKSFYKRIGNLTFLNTKVNSDLKSANFNIKKEEYKKSTILISNKLADINVWSIEEIKKRQFDFAEKAVKIWNLKLK
jgi:uncharacterized protein with ParB-like and HNH nuclease domain